MKTMRKKAKRLLAVLLAFAVVTTAADWSVLTALAKAAAQTADGGYELQVTETSVDQETGATVYHTEPVYLGNVFQTSVPDKERSGYAPVPVKSTDEVLWIDRIADLTEGTREFYELLIEGGDNDGDNDFLIDPGTEQLDLTAATVTVPREEGVSLGTQASAVFNQYVCYMIAAYASLDRDHPEIFWLSGRLWLGSSYYEEGGNLVYTFILPVQNASGTIELLEEKYQDVDFLKENIALRDSLVEEILEGAVGLTDYETIRYFNEYLTHHNAYNTRVGAGATSATVDSDAWACISALEGRVGEVGPVCEAYSRAFKVLCDQVGIPCILEDGLGNGGAHMWNNVKLEGDWYAVDVTWNDPYDGSSDKVSGYEHEGWLLLGSETFSSSHVVENNPYSSVALPNSPKLHPYDYNPDGSGYPASPMVFDTEQVVVDEGYTAAAYGSEIEKEDLIGVRSVFNDMVCANEYVWQVYDFTLLQEDALGVGVGLTEDFGTLSMTFDVSDACMDGTAVFYQLQEDGTAPELTQVTVQNGLVTVAVDRVAPILMRVRATAIEQYYNVWITAEDPRGLTQTVGVGEYFVGETVTVKGITKAGHRFKCWDIYHDGTYMGMDAGEEEAIGSTVCQTYTFTQPEAMVRLVYQTEVLVYDIEYEMNGGSVTGNFVYTYTVEDTAPIVVENLTRDDHIFLGWTGSNGTVPQRDLVIVPSEHLGDLHYEANWQWDGTISQVTVTAENPLSVFWTAGDGMHPEDSEVTVTASLKPGYSFGGWRLQEGEDDRGIVLGTYEEVGGETVYSYSFVMPEVPVTLKFTTMLNHYNITYELDGGVLEYDNHASYNVEMTNTITLPNPTKNGYTFLGWTGSNGTVPQLEVSFVPAETTGDLHYVANWQQEGPVNAQLTVNHWLQKLGAASDAETPENYELKDTSNDTVIAGSLQTPAVNSYEGFTAPQGVQVTVSKEGTTVDYYYTRNRYPVTVQAGDGYVTISGNGTYEYGAAVTIGMQYLPGYGFGEVQIGVVADIDGAEIRFTMPDQSVEGIVLSQVSQYLLQYEYDGGEAEGNPSHYTVETETFTLNDPTKPGYHFTGWIEDGGDGPQMTVTIEKGSIGHRTYQATWEVCPAGHLTDVEQGAWYHDFVDYVVTHGLLNGTSPTTFEPGKILDRSSLVTILYNISGERATASPAEKEQWILAAEAQFTDLVYDWYKEAIGWAITKNITSGTGDGTTFSPSGEVTREQFVVFLQRFYIGYLGLESDAVGDLSGFVDAGAISSWARSGVEWGVAEGILSGKGNGQLAPLDPATRMEAAVLIRKFHEKLQ